MREVHKEAAEESSSEKSVGGESSAPACCKCSKHLQVALDLRAASRNNTVVVYAHLPRSKHCQAMQSPTRRACLVVDLLQTQAAKSQTTWRLPTWLSGTKKLLSYPRPHDNFHLHPTHCKRTFYPTVSPASKCILRALGKRKVLQIFLVFFFSLRRPLRRCSTLISGVYHKQLSVCSFFLLCCLT